MLTLDEAVAAALERVHGSGNASFKEMVYAVLRRGLQQLETPANPRAPFRTRTVAIGHRLTLCSADAGFARFPGLRWINPLAGQTIG